MIEKITDIFYDSYEYPSRELVVDDILPNNVMLEYISSTYLNGFINYVTLKKVMLLKRYRDEHSDRKLAISSPIPDKLKQLIADHAKLVDDSNEHWPVYEFDSNETYHKAWLLNVDIHVEFSSLNDDCLIVAESKKHWWFFWYDMDCSDCAIGRVSKEDCTEELFMKWFDDYINDLEYPAEEIPIDKFKGWLSS